jgi:hypothetical protein
MLKEPAHLTDQELLMLADGEASRRDAKQARGHLEACWACRTRLAELEGAIADFVSLHQSVMPMEPVSAPRALLKAKLAQAAGEEKRPRLLELLGVHRRYAFLGLAMLVLLGGGMLLRHTLLPASSPVTAGVTVPDPRLTPGVTRPVSLGDVCSIPHEEVVRAVPGFLRDQVFREYGIANPKVQDYEIDYLIAPGLGGADDIQNLWPEPEVSAGWNSHDKDLLEERLHQMVCSGQIDLSTAQKAIASDWIQAYKKYLPKSA